MVSMSGLTDTLNAWSAVWWSVIVRNSIDVAVLLAVLFVVWLPMRRWMSNQFTIWLFSLVLLKLALPVTLELPVPWAAIWPSSHVSTRPQTVSLQPATLVPRELQPQPVSTESHRLCARRTRNRHSAPPIRDLRIEPAPASNTSFERLLPWKRRPRSGSTSRAEHTGDGDGAWFAIIVFLSARLIRSNLQLTRQLRTVRCLDPDGLPIDWSHLRTLAGVRHEVPLVETELVAAPAVWGLFRTRVLLPDGLIERVPSRPLAWILLHELTHIRRHDLWLNLFQRVVQIAYFFHPAAWIAGRLIQVRCEYACDDAALAACRETPRQECGLGLLTVVEQAQQRRARAELKLGLGLFGASDFLRVRVLRILDTRRVLTTRLSFGAVVLLSALAIVTVPYVRAQIRTSDQFHPGNQTLGATGPQSRVLDNATYSLPIPAGSQSAGIRTASGPKAAGIAHHRQVTVINAKTLRPEPGVTILYGNNSPQKQGLTDSEGRFLLTDEVSETGHLLHRFHKSGFVPIQVFWNSGLSEPRLKNPSNYTVKLEPGSTIGGSVRDEQGHPVSGASVRVSISSELRESR